MFCNRTVKHSISRLHERGLRIAYHDYLSDFEDLLARDDTVTVYKHIPRTLAIKMYKMSNDVSKDMMTEICVPYNTRQKLSMGGGKGKGGRIR